MLLGGGAGRAVAASMQMPVRGTRKRRRLLFSMTLAQQQRKGTAAKALWTRPEARRGGEACRGYRRRQRGVLRLPAAMPRARQCPASGFSSGVELKVGHDSFCLMAILAAPPARSMAT
jgi:hypothetical protein